MLLYKRWEKASTGENVGVKREHLYTRGRNVNQYSFYGKHDESSSKINKNWTIMWSNNSTSGYISKRNEIIVSKRHLYSSVCAWVLSCLGMSDSLQPHGLQPTSLLCPWAYPGKNSGVGCHFFHQGILLIQELTPHLLQWQADSLSLCWLGSPLSHIFQHYLQCQDKETTYSSLIDK